MTHEPFVRPGLNVDDVTVTYNNGHTAIHNASFTLSGGSICALVGVNGRQQVDVVQSIMGLVRAHRRPGIAERQTGGGGAEKNLIATCRRPKTSTGTSRCWWKTW